MQNNNSNEENPVTPPPTRRQIEVERTRVTMEGALAPARQNFFMSREILIANQVNQTISQITDPVANPASP